MNLAYAALATIRSQHGFHRDLIPRTRFAHTCTGTLQPGPAPFSHQIEIQLYILDRGSVVGIVVDASEALAKRKRSSHRRGLSVLRRRKHVLERDFREAFHADAAIETISNFLAVFIHAMQRIEHGRHNRHRAKARIVQYFVVEDLRPGATVNGQRYWNHLRLFVEHAHDARMPILHEDAGRLGGVDNLESIQRRRQRGQHLRLIHRQVNRSKLKQRMPAGKQALRINIGNRASSFDIHVAAHQHGANG